MVAVAISGCAATTHPLTPEVAASLRGRRLATTVRAPTPLFAQPPGNSNEVVIVPAMPGVLAGAMAGATIGLLKSDTVSDRAPGIARQVADPAQLIAGRLGEDLRREMGLLPANQAVYLQDDDLARITAADPSADLVLDVWVNSMRLGRLQKSVGYGLSYGAYIRLIDAKVVHPIDGKKGIVIAHGSCSRPAKETPDAPSYGGFMANGAERLKHEIDLAVQFCVDRFRSRVLGIGPPPFAHAVVVGDNGPAPQSASSLSTETGR